MNEPAYRQSFTVRWGDLDPNGHMKNTAYLDACVETRFGYFASQGVAFRRFNALGIGPVVRRDQVEYYRELRFQESYEVDLTLAGISPDGSHFRLRNQFYRASGTLAAAVASTGGWLDIRERKLVPAPPPVLAALQALQRSDAFEELPSSVRRG